MKFLKLMTLSSAWAQRNVTGNANNEEVPAGLLARRYTDLLSIVYHYNPDFDERKYWAYGCNCLMLGKSLTVIPRMSPKQGALTLRLAENKLSQLDGPKMTSIMIHNLQTVRL